MRKKIDAEPKVEYGDTSKALISEIEKKQL